MDTANSSSMAAAAAAHLLSPIAQNGPPVVPPLAFNSPIRTLQPSTSMFAMGGGGRDAVAGAVPDALGAATLGGTLPAGGLGPARMARASAAVNDLSAAVAKLHVGSYVALCAVDLDGFLAAEGFMDVRPRIEPRYNLLENHAAVSRDFGDCVFQVMGGLQYTAAEALACAPVGANIAALQEAARLEARQNAETERKQNGTELVYGQVVQLRHIKSGKFLTVKPRQLAETEKESTRVELLSRGSDAARFVILPRYKHRSEGDPVNLSDQIILKLPNAQAFLHVSENDDLETGMREVNVCNTYSRWALQLYVDYGELRASSPCLKGGDYVRFLHVEHDSFVLFDLKSAAESAAGGGLVEFQKAVVQEGATSGGVEASTNALWILEHQNPSRGGSIFYSQYVRFRHVATGWYAAVVGFGRGGFGAAGARPSAASVGFLNGTSPNPSMQRVVCIPVPSDDTLFSLFPTAGSDNGPIPYATPGLRVHHEASGTWVQAARVVEAAMTPAAVPETIVDTAGVRHLEAPAGIGPVTARTIARVRANNAKRKSKLAASKNLPGVPEFKVMESAALQADRVTESDSEEEEEEQAAGGASQQSQDTVSPVPMLLPVQSRVQAPDGRRELGGSSVMFGSAEDLYGEAQDAAAWAPTPGNVAAGVEQVHLVASRDQNHEDVFRVVLALPVELQETLSLISAFNPLRDYLRKVADHPEQLSQNDETKVMRVLAELLWFCVEDTEPLPANIPAHQLTGVPIKRRQRLLREQHVVELLVDMLTTPFATWDGPFQLNDIAVERERVRDAKRRYNMSPDLSTNGNSSSQRESPLLMVHRISRLVYRVLTFVFKSNREAELQVAKHIDVFLAQIGFDFTAESMLSELLGNNIQLLEQLAAEDVHVFVELIRRSGKKPEFLQFLTALCSCLGKGVPSKQEMVCDMIFGNGDGVLRERVLMHSFMDQAHVGGSWSTVIRHMLSTGLGGALDIVLLTREIDAEDPMERRMEVYVGNFPDFGTFCRSQDAREHLADPAGDNRAALPAAKEQKLRHLHADKVSQLLSLGTDEWVSLDTLFASFQDPESFRFRQDAGEYQVLGEYFIAMLNLYTEMCLNRNYVCIGVLRRLFTRDAMFQVIQNQSMPQLLRSSFCRLMLNMYVDVKPQTAISVSARPRLWHQLATEVDANADLLVTPVKSSSKLKDLQFFTDLRSFCVEYLTDLRGCMVASERSKNKLTLSILILCKKLLSFGFFSSHTFIMRLCAAAIPVLDGRGDQVIDPRAAYGRLPSKSMADITSPAAHGVGTKGGHHRYMLDANSAVLMDCKLVICEILQFVAELRLQHQLSRVLSVFYEHHALFERNLDVSTSWRPSHFKSNKIVPGVFGGSEPANMQETVGSELRAKIMDAFEDAVIDTRMSLRTFCEADIVAIFFDLLMYQHDGLVAASLDLLMREFGVRVMLSSALQEVQLLVSDAAEHVYRSLQQLTPELTALVESDEVWMGFDTAQDRQAGRRARYLIQLMTDMMWVGYRSHVEDDADKPSDAVAWMSAHMDAADGDDTAVHSNLAAVYGSRWRASPAARDTVDAGRQLLMSNMGVAQLIITLLKDGSSVWHARELIGQDQVPNSFVHSMRKLFAVCYHFLVVFMRRNPDNQMLVFQHAQLLRAHVQAGVSGPLVFTGMWLNNLPLCRDVDIDMVRVFVDLIASRGTIPALLSPLHALVFCFGRVIPENQTLVCRILMDKLSATMPLFQDSTAYVNQLLTLCAHRPTMDALRQQLVHDGTFGPSLFAQFGHADWSKEQQLRAQANSLVGAEGGLPKTRAVLPFYATTLTDDAWAPALHLHTGAVPNALLYHVRLVQLLTKCCYGQNFEVEAMCQGLLPLDVLVSALLNRSVPLEMRCVLHEFLFEAWLFTQQTAASVHDCKSLIALFAAEATELPSHFYTNTPVEVGDSKDNTDMPPIVDRVLDPSEAVIRWRVQNVLPMFYTFRALLPSYRAYVAHFRDKDDYALAAGDLEDDNAELFSQLVRMTDKLLSSLEHIFSTVLLNGKSVLLALSPLEREEVMAVCTSVVGSKPLIPCHEKARWLHRIVAHAETLPSQGMLGLEAISDDIRHHLQFQHFVELLHAELRSRDTAQVTGIEDMVSSMIGVKQLVRRDIDTLKGGVARPALALELRRMPSGRLVQTNTDFSKWVAPEIEFDELVHRLIEYGCSVGTEDGPGLRVVLSVVQRIVDKASRRPQRSAVSEAQNTLEDHGAVRMLFSQLCERWWDVDFEMYLSILQACCALLQGGNKIVQSTFLELMRASPEAFVSGLAAVLDHFAMALRSLPLQPRLFQLAGFREEPNGAASPSPAAGGTIEGFGGQTAVPGAAAAAPNTIPPTLGDVVQGGSHRRTLRSHASLKGIANTANKSVRRLDIAPRRNSAVDAVNRQAATDDESTNMLVDAQDLAVLQSLFKFLQLLCEGHNADMQNFLRDQRANGTNPSMASAQSAHNNNLVAMTCQILEILHGRITSQNADLCLQVLDTLIEFVQGPCLDNQQTLVSNKIVEVLSRLMHLTVADLEQLDLSIGTAKVFQYKLVLAALSLFEGRQDNKVHQRVASLIELPPLRRLLTTVYADVIRYHEGEYQEAAFLQKFVSHNERTGSSEFDDQAALDRLSRSAMVETGFSAFILMQQLSDHVPEFNEELHSSMDSTVVTVDDAAVFGHKQLDVTFNMAWTFFAQHCARVEILRDGGIERFYFPVPPMCYHLTEPTRERVKWDIDRDSPGKKLADFFNRYPTMLQEMRHQQRLQAFFKKTRVLSFLSSAGYRWKTLSFGLALVINLLVLICYEELGSGSTCGTNILQRETGIPWQSVISVLGALQTTTSSLIVLFFYLNYGPLLWQRGYDQWRSRQPLANRLIKVSPTAHLAQQTALRPIDGRKTRKLHELLTDQRSLEAELERLSRPFVFLIAAASMLRSGEFVYYSAYVAMTILGNAVHQFFFAFHLIDIVMRYEELKIVLQSVLRPLKPLLLTAALFGVMQFFFALVGFTYFRLHYPGGDCSTLFRCFWSTFDMGFKNNGGVGGGLVITTSELDGTIWGLRMLYDNLYNILVLTVLLNIVFGIIIDTFAELRTQTKEKEEDMTSKCFICNIDRAAFDKAARSGFELHLRRDHYMWHYLYMIAYLTLKSPTELTGVEGYLLTKILQRDLSFFPVNRAMALDPETTKDDENALTLAGIQRDLTSMRNELAKEDRERQETASREAQMLADIADLRKQLEELRAATHPADHRPARSRAGSTAHID